MLIHLSPPTPPLVISGKSLASVVILVNNNASQRAKDAQGKTPLQLAQYLFERHGDSLYSDIVSYLEAQSVGATPASPSIPRMQGDDMYR